MFSWAGMWLTLVRHACARRQNNFKVHVLRWRELLAYDARKDSFIHVCDDETFKARRLDWEDEFRFRGKSKVS
jgi:hypothetical protein